ncbi:hypothetical protein [Geobacillus sp. C56-T2]|nr:hypothetical protein [Geobacillus sp. C56-T2]TWG29871.1 hypothetical protein GC56T2_0983 [Geobacillus sp. C56-T2]
MRIGRLTVILCAAKLIAMAAAQKAGADGKLSKGGLFPSAPV